MKQLLFSLCLISFAAACSHDDQTAQQQDPGRAVIDCAATDEVAATRANIDCTIPSAEEFSLMIEGVSLQYSSSWQTIAEFNADNYLYAGSYKAVVEAGDIASEGYDTAAWRGEQTFEITARQQTDVSVTAHIANALVKIDFTDNFRRYFTGGWQLTLTTAAGNSFDVSEPSDRPLFIAPESFAVSGTAVKQPSVSGGDGVEVALPLLERGDLAGQTLYTVTFDVSTAGSATLEILLDDTPVESITIENELNDNAQ